jgi:hypothetical protein
MVIRLPSGKNAQQLCTTSDLPTMANQIRTIELRQISTTGKSLLIFRNRVKPRNQKYFPSPPTQIRCISEPSRPDRGALRTSRNAGRDAVDAAASGEQQRAGRMMPKRTAKSCRPGAPMPASSLREAAQATVSNKHGHRGEREVSRKTIARGMPGDFRCDRGDYARVFIFLHTRLRVHRAPGIPCALCYRRRERFAKLGRNRTARSRSRILKLECRHCEEQRDEAIHSFLARPHGLLRLRSQ